MTNGSAPGGSTPCADEGLDAVARYLEQVWGDAATRFRLAAENTHRR